MKKVLIPLSAILISWGIFFFWAFPQVALRKMALKSPHPKAFQQWIASQSTRELIQLSLDKPFRKAVTFREIRRRSSKEQFKLLIFMKTPQLPMLFRLQSFLALTEGPSPYRQEALLLATHSAEDPITNTALGKIARFGGKIEVGRLMEMLDEPHSIWTKTLVVRALGQIVSATFLPSGKLSEESLKAATLVWKNWWQKNRDREPLQWYMDLFNLGDLSHQQRAVELMGRWGKREPQKTFDLLARKGMASAYFQVVVRTLGWLNHLNPARALAFLKKGIHHPSPVVRIWSLRYLRGYREPLSQKYRFRSPLTVVTALDGILKDPSWKVRQQAVKILGYKHFHLGLSLLLKALKDSNVEVQYESAWSLQKQGRKDGAVLALRDLDNSFRLRRAIVLLRAIFKTSFGLSAGTPPYELRIIGKRWKRFLANHK